MSNIFDGYTLLVVVAFAIMSIILYLSIKMSDWDWYRFWTGGPRRNVIFEILKRVI